MGMYEQAAVAGVINSQNVSGVNAEGLLAASGPTANQAAWMKYGAIVAGAAVLGAVLGGRGAIIPGAIAGTAAVALFGDITWTG